MNWAFYIACVRCGEGGQLKSLILKYIISDKGLCVKKVLQMVPQNPYGISRILDGKIARELQSHFHWIILAGAWRASRYILVREQVNWHSGRLFARPEHYLTRHIRICFPGVFMRLAHCHVAKGSRFLEILKLFIAWLRPTFDLMGFNTKHRPKSPICFYWTLQEVSLHTSSVYVVYFHYPCLCGRACSAAVFFVIVLVLEKARVRIAPNGRNYISFSSKDHPYTKANWLFCYAFSKSMKKNMNQIKLIGERFSRSLYQILAFGLCLSFKRLRAYVISSNAAKNSAREERLLASQLWWSLWRLWACWEFAPTTDGLKAWICLEALVGLDETWIEQHRLSCGMSVA